MGNGLVWEWGLSGETICSFIISYFHEKRYTFGFLFSVIDMRFLENDLPNIGFFAGANRT